MELQIRKKCKFLEFAPIVDLSALTGYGVDKLLPQVMSVYEKYRKNIPTGRLNDCVKQAVEKNPISSYSGKFVKLHYTTQVKTRPPTFKCFVNYPKGIHFSYKRYLINSLRKTFGFSGTPVRLIFSKKSKRN